MRPGDFFVPGLGPLPVGASPLAGSLLAFPAETYISPMLDFTQPISGIELIPAKQGHLPISPLLGVTYFAVVIKSVTGTQTTPAHFRAGSDPGHVNFFSLQSAPINSDVNSAVPPSLGQINSFVGGRQMFANTPVILDITTGAIGTDSTFSLTGYIVAYVMWMGTANQ